jgi:hypothetical protein
MKVERLSDAPLDGQLENDTIILEALGGFIGRIR